MKKTLYGVLGLTLAFGLAGCSDDPSIDSNPKEQVVTPKDEGAVNTPDDKSAENSGNKSVGDVQDPNASKQMAELDFTKFDLEIDYGPNKKFDFDYEQKSDNGNYKAELYDEIHDKKLKGLEAFQALYTQMKDLNLNANTTKEEAIPKILQVFQLSPDYTNFDLEYTLKDGTKVDIEDRK